MREKELPLVFVNPGEFYLSERPEVLLTILGSCVAIIMYEKERGLCGLSHCIFPSSEFFSDKRTENDHYKFVDTAIAKMISEFKKKNIQQENIKVKIFGGAEQLSAGNSGNASVGRKNIEKSFECLDARHMKIISSDVGGTTGRKIYVVSNTGEVYLSRLGKQGNK